MAISRNRDRESLGAPPQRSDAYTGLLAISLGALLVSCLLLFLDLNQYDAKKPTLPPRPNFAAQPAAAPQAPGGGAPDGGMPPGME